MNSKWTGKLFFCTMPYLSAYLYESLDFFKVGILGLMNTLKVQVEETIFQELIFQ